MKVTNPGNNDFREIHKFIGQIEGLVQHPLHFYKIMTKYFRDSFFIIKQDGNIIGLVWGFISQADKSIFFLWQIGVSEEFRGKKISHKLISSLIKFAGENNCKKVHATVETDNIASWKMFEKLGFNIESEGKTITEHGRKALPDYYGSGTDQFLYAYDLTREA